MIDATAGFFVGFAVAGFSAGEFAVDSIDIVVFSFLGLFVDGLFVAVLFVVDFAIAGFVIADFAGDAFDIAGFTVAGFLTVGFSIADLFIIGAAVVDFLSAGISVLRFCAIGFSVAGCAVVDTVLDFFIGMSETVGKLVSSVDGDNVVYVGDGFEVTGLFIVNGIVGLKLQT